jgi:hypothetical protein
VAPLDLREGCDTTPNPNGCGFNISGHTERLPAEPQCGGKAARPVRVTSDFPCHVLPPLLIPLRLRLRGTFLKRGAETTHSATADKAEAGRVDHRHSLIEGCGPGVTPSSRR